MKTNRVANLLVTSIILTLISAVIKYYNVTEKGKTIQLITNTYDIIRQSDKLLSTVQEAEDNQREYFIARDSLSLELFWNAQPVLDNEYAALYKLTSENPRQTELLNHKIGPQLSSLVEALNDEIRKFQRNENLPFPKLDSSRTTLSNLRTSLGELTAHEEELLTARQARLQKIYTINDTIHYAFFLLICVISGLALKVLLDKEKNNVELLAAVKEANRNLELKIHERTMELEKKNILMEKLNRDLQDNFNELQSFYETLHVTNEKAEDTLSEIRDLYENAPSGYHSLNKDGIIVRMNQTELNWLGYSRDEVVGKMHVTRVLVPEEHQTYRDSFQAFLANGFIHNKNHTFLRKDGTTFPVLLNATAILDENGHYVMSRGIVTNLESKTKG